MFWGPIERERVGNELAMTEVEMANYVAEMVMEAAMMGSHSRVQGSY
jgi:hypothetical protein